MINPNDIKEFEKNSVINLYKQINQEIISLMINKLQKTEFTDYNIKQIRRMAKKESKSIVEEVIKKTNKLNNEQKRQLRSLLTELELMQMSRYERLYKERDIDLSIPESLPKLIMAIYKRTNKDLKNITKSLAFKSQEEYIKAIDELFMKVATGKSDYSSAMKSTINNLADRGIRLKDSAGRNVKLETAVRRNLMTGLTQMANEISEEVGKVIGANCVVIGHTPYCRPTHEVIDGVVMSLEEFSKYEHLTTEPNCYHIVNYDWRPEFSKLNRKEVIYNGHLTKKEYEENYLTRNRQTELARRVRNHKEKVNILQKSNLTKDNESILETAKRNLRKAQLDYRNFCKFNHIDIDYDLVWQHGYNK